MGFEVSFFAIKTVTTSTLSRLGLAVVFLCSTSIGALAQPARSMPSTNDDRSGGSFTTTGLISVQPSQDDSPPYLQGALGGVAPGLALSVSAANKQGLLLAVEFSTTTRIGATQSGRFVGGNQSVRVDHRDEILSFLAGVGIEAGQKTDVEIRGGVSIISGKSRREEEPFDSQFDADGLAYTVTLGVVTLVSKRVAVVPSLNYYLRSQGGSNSLGLGRHIFRPGIGVRVRF